MERVGLELESTFTFALKVTGSHPPSEMTISLRSAINGKYAHQPPAADGLRGVSLSGEVAADFAQVYKVFMGAGASDYPLSLDDLSFR